MSVDGLLGSMLVGTWATTALFTFQLTWAVQYYRHACHQDGLYFRALVAVILIIDLAGLIGANANVYLYCVSHWGDAEFLGHTYWPVPFCFVTETVTNAIVQGFLVLRYFRFSKNWYVRSTLSFFMVITLGSGLAVAILGTKWEEVTVEERLLFQIPIKLWLIGDVVTNVCISLALSYEFYRHRTGLRTTDTMLHRLIALSIQSAAIPTFCAVAALVAYLRRPDTNISAIFLWFLPRAYILTMLYTLNVRQNIREESRIREPGRGSTAIYTMGGIQFVGPSSVEKDNVCLELSESNPHKTRPSLTTDRSSQV